MGFVKHDPTQLATRLLDYRPVLGTNEHILQHSRVGNQHGGGGMAQRPPRDLLRPGAPLLVCRCRLRKFAVVEAETDVVSETAAPSAESVALTVDEGIQRVEKQRPYSRQGARAGAFTGQVFENRYQEALGFPGARTGCYQHRMRHVVEQEFPAFELMSKRLPSTGECVFAVFPRWPFQRRHHIPAKDATSSKPDHFGLGLPPAERGFYHGVRK